jgi:hypothetical protein
MLATIQLLKCRLQQLGISDSVAFLLAATLYQGHPDRTQALEYRINLEMYTPYSGILKHNNGNLHNEKIKIMSSVVAFRSQPVITVNFNV